MAGDKSVDAKDAKERKGRKEKQMKTEMSVELLRHNRCIRPVLSDS
jgi:hypothetical protein